MRPNHRREAAPFSASGVLVCSHDGGVGHATIGIDVDA
jgi:hypothetical protein